MYSEKLAQVKINAKPEIVSAVKSANTEANLRGLIQKYHLHIDKAEEAFSALMLLCYGAINSSECFRIIHEMQIISDIEFVNFIQEINQQILNPIQDEIKKSVLRPQQEIEKSYDESLQDVSVAKEQNIEDFFESIGLNPDGSEKETYEEMMARIDKEVEDEITLEIQAELAEEARKKAEQEKIELENKQKINTDFEHDLDLDSIPKTQAPTYNAEHLLPEINTDDYVSQKPKNVTQDKYSELSDNLDEEDLKDAKQNSLNALDFIQSRATGDIALRPEPKKSVGADYIKDPYRESL